MEGGNGNGGVQPDAAGRLCERAGTETTTEGRGWGGRGAVAFTRRSGGGWSGCDRYTKGNTGGAGGGGGGVGGGGGGKRMGEGG